MNKKQIPNVMSISRIMLSFVLVFFFQNPQVFIPLYLLIGMTDMLDGYIARKLKAESTFGAKLDSIGDFVFYIILTVYLLFIHNEILFAYWVPILLIFVLRVCNAIVGWQRHKKLTMLHTIANKVVGLMVFILPIMLYFGLKKYLILTIIMAFLATIEELIIILKCEKEKIDLNRKHL